MSCIVLCVMIGVSQISGLICIDYNGRSTILLQKQNKPCVYKDALLFHNNFMIQVSPVAICYFQWYGSPLYIIVPHLLFSYRMVKLITLKHTDSQANVNDEHK